MDADFTVDDGIALYRLLAEQSSDIVLKCDRDGIVRHASSAVAKWALPCARGAHILDMVDPASRPVVANEFAALIAGRTAASAEFPAPGADGAQRWFEIRLRRLVDDLGEAEGAVALVRNIEDRRAYEEKLFAAAMTDPLTGLTNRRAFMSMLQHLVDGGGGGCLALFGLDYFKALNMRYGQSFGDEVLVVFSDLLRNMMRSEDTISRIGSETLGVLLPGARADQAEAVCQRVIAALAEIRQAAGPDSVSITASVGVSRIARTLDATMKRAEMALFLAKAKGRNRLEMDSGQRPGGTTRATTSR